MKSITAKDLLATEPGWDSVITSEQKTFVIRQVKQQLGYLARSKQLKYLLVDEIVLCEYEMPSARGHLILKKDGTIENKTKHYTNPHADTVAIISLDDDLDSLIESIRLDPNVLCNLRKKIEAETVL